MSESSKLAENEQPRTMAARRALGQKLRELREEYGFSGEQVAARCGWSQAKVSRIESAATRTDVDDIGLLLTAYRVEGSDRDALMELAVAASVRTRAWWNELGVALDTRTRQKLALEADAATISGFHHAVLPGIVQTGEYARSIFRLTSVDCSQIEQDHAVAYRAARRESVLQSVRQYNIIVTDVALSWRASSVEVHRSQLRSLVDDVYNEENITFRIICGYPRGGVAPQPTFSLYEYGGEAPAVAYVEHSTGVIDVGSARSVVYYQEKFAELETLALTRDESVRYLEKLLDEEV